VGKAVATEAMPMAQVGAGRGQVARFLLPSLLPSFSLLFFSSFFLPPFIEPCLSSLPSSMWCQNEGCVAAAKRHRSAVVWSEGHVRQSPRVRGSGQQCGSRSRWQRVCGEMRQASSSHRDAHVPAMVLL